MGKDYVCCPNDCDGTAIRIHCVCCFARNLKRQLVPGSPRFRKTIKEQIKEFV